MTEKFSHDIVKENIVSVCHRIETSAKNVGRTASDIKLLAATKTVCPETINYAIENGIKYIGENRVQELLEKYAYLDLNNAQLHFIGHLQTNKVKYIIDKVKMIHSVDSVKLASEIDKQAHKHGICMPVLAEINIAKEESKSGIYPELAEQFMYDLSRFENIKVCGLMSVPPKIELTSKTQFDNEITLENDEFYKNGKKIYKNQSFFQKIMKLFLDISAKKIDNIYMQELSIGMSDDFEQAIENGSTIVRIGRTLFGSR